jgi:hypothetical protein
MAEKMKIQALDDGNTSIMFLVLEARRHFEGLYIYIRVSRQSSKLSKLVIVEIEYLIKEMGA